MRDVVRLAGVDNAVVDERWPEVRDAAVDAYEQLAPDDLSDRVAPGVGELLAALAARPGEFRLALLTGGHVLLEGVRLPPALKVRVLGNRQDQFSRPDLVFIAVPSKGMGPALAEIQALGLSDHAGVVLYVPILDTWRAPPPPAGTT